MKLSKLLLSGALALNLLTCLNTAYADLSQQIKALGNQPAKTAGLTVYNLNTGRSVYRKNANAQLKPASILKLLTSAAALEKFGADYKFKTKLYGKFKDAKTLSELAIVGSGDPVLRSEDLWMLARRLKNYDIKTVDKLVVDASLFSDALPASGQSAYQAGSSALAFNFNTLRVTACPARRAGSNAIISWEPLEYRIDLTGKIATTSGGGTLAVTRKNDRSFAVSGVARAGRDCTDVYRSISTPEKMLASTFEQYLNYLGIRFSGVIEYRKANKSNWLATHESKPLGEILANLNKYSSNFIAEQVLHLIGNGSRKAGLRVMGEYLRQLGVDSGEFVLEDASGLSHGNRISANALEKVFIRAFNDPKINSEYLASLAVNNSTGTLKRRKLSSGTVLRGKTGTINGVDSLAGMVQSKKTGQKFFFVLMQNGISGGTQAYENRLIELLAKS